MGLRYEDIMPKEEQGEKVRKFESGATRGANVNKLDYEGFESPAVMRRYAQYMNRHRVQPDGTIRASDNWQKGIPQEEYLKSLLRHVMDVWLLMRGFSTFDPETGAEVDLEDALCGVRFNTNGLLFEKLLEKEGKR